MTASRNNNRRITTPQSLNTYVKGICDIMRRSNCSGALQYVPELTWMLFLQILDDKETREAEYAKAVGTHFQPSLEYPYRWQDWAAPDGKKRLELQMGALGGFMSFTDTAAQAKKKPDEQSVTEAHSCFLHQSYLFWFKISLHWLLTISSSPSWLTLPAVGSRRGFILSLAASRSRSHARTWYTLLRRQSTPCCRIHCM